MELGRGTGHNLLNYYDVHDICSMFVTFVYGICLMVGMVLANGDGETCKVIWGWSRAGGFVGTTNRKRFFF